MHLGMARTAHLLLVDGFADWEPALLVATLRRYAGYRTIALGRNSLPVLSMGGLRVLPESSIGSASFGPEDIVVVPGGDFWTRGEDVDTSAFLRRAREAGAVVAGICAGVAALAWAGLLRDRRYTANTPEEIRSFLAGARPIGTYVDAPAVADGDVVTAKGNAPVAFAESAIAALGVFDASQSDAWRRVFRPA